MIINIIINNCICNNDDNININDDNYNNYNNKNNNDNTVNTRFIR